MERKKVSFLSIQLIVFVFALSAFAGLASAQKYSKCLPGDIKEDTVVGWDNPSNSERPAKPITVRQTLAKLKARCVCDKLVDARGKEIKFFQLQGCWGQPPPNYLAIMEKQRVELDALKKKFVVIEMTCNQSGIPRY